MKTALISTCRASLTAIANMLDNLPSGYLIMQRIRLSRVKLGSALERLESFEPGPVALGELQDHSENIAFQIDSLIQAICELMGDKRLSPLSPPFTNHIPRPA